MSTGWSAGISVAFTIDVSWNDANPKMKLSAKHTPAGNAITSSRQVMRPPIRYANATAITVPMVTRQNTMVGAEASMPFTNSGPNPTRTPPARPRTAAARSAGAARSCGVTLPESHF